MKNLINKIDSNLDFNLFSRFGLLFSDNPLLTKYVINFIGDTSTLELKRIIDDSLNEIKWNPS